MHILSRQDIFGFEIFEHNSFEQLCINYTNEPVRISQNTIFQIERAALHLYKAMARALMLAQLLVQCDGRMLQQHFDNNTFKLEEKIYADEGIDFEHVDIIDNQPMIDLITKRHVGILPLLDEELIVPRGSDKKFLSKLAKSQKKEQNAAFEAVRFKPFLFVVRHYAGDVTYDGQGFLEKNRDTLTPDLVEMLQTSTSPFINKLYPPKMTLSDRDRKSSLSKQFQGQLRALMGQLYKTEPHYIRCIKPNDDKAKLTFVPRNCFEQLTYSGVFEAVAIRKQGFPFRLPHKEFSERYGKLCKPKIAGGQSTFRRALLTDWS